MRMRRTEYIERFEYVCKNCGAKGTVVDVLLNPDVLLIRGHCAACNTRGVYKVVDLETLRKEYEQIERDEAADAAAGGSVN